MDDMNKRIQMDDMYAKYGNRSIYNPDNYGCPAFEKELRDTAQMDDDEFDDYMYDNYPYDPEYAINGKDDWSSVPFGDYTGRDRVNMKKNRIKLNENTLRGIIRESLYRMLNEDDVKCGQ